MQSGTRFRVYVDGEAEPSLDYDLFLFHGIGFAGDQSEGFAPWGTRRAGHTAYGGGLYNTFRIPYSTSVRVTATSAYAGFFWYIIRGVENYPLVLGDLQLPGNARLRLYKNVNVSLDPYEFLTMAKVTSSAGALFLVVFAASNNESDPQYLEACFRAIVDGGPTTYLSSGTEDFFLSAYYFDGGGYHLENAGVTFIGSRSSTVSAYKYFESDPVLFNSSFLLLWRAGESDNGVDGCPCDFPPPSVPGKRSEACCPVPVTTGITTVTTYVLMYEW